MTPEGPAAAEAGGVVARRARRRRSFRPVLDDPTADHDAVERLVLCSGKLYYDIVGHERARRSAGTSPSRGSSSSTRSRSRPSRRCSASYPRLREVVWAQEEPQNMGPWRSIRHRLEETVRASESRWRAVRRPDVEGEPERGLPDRAPARAGPHRAGRARRCDAGSADRARPAARAADAAAAAPAARRGPCVRAAASSSGAVPAAACARAGRAPAPSATGLVGDARHGCIQAHGERGVPSIRVSYTAAWPETPRNDRTETRWRPRPAFPTTRSPTTRTDRRLGARPRDPGAPRPEAAERVARRRHAARPVLGRGSVREPSALQVARSRRASRRRSTAARRPSESPALPWPGEDTADDGARGRRARRRASGAARATSTGASSRRRGGSAPAVCEDAGRER